MPLGGHSLPCSVTMIWRKPRQTENVSFAKVITGSRRTVIESPWPAVKSIREREREREREGGGEEERRRSRRRVWPKTAHDKTQNNPKDKAGGTRLAVVTQNYPKTRRAVLTQNYPKTRRAVQTQNYPKARRAV